MLILDGKATAAEIRAGLAKETAALTQTHHRPPHLAVVLVGEDPPSRIYVRYKEKACAEVGIQSRTLRVESNISQVELEQLVSDLCSSQDIDGVLIQVPLPAHLDLFAVQALVPPEKDVDGFAPQSVGRLSIGLPCLAPCTPLGVMRLLERYEIPLAGKKAVVLGRSNIVGKPMAMLLAASQANATVTICHSRTRDLAWECRQADILVAAIGQARIITKDMIKPGAVVVDVGMNRAETGLCGDVDYQAVKDVASAITPVPGGVGPMTIAMLLRNTVEAFKARMARGHIPKGG